MPRELQEGDRWSLVVGALTCDFQRFNSRVDLQWACRLDGYMFVSVSCGTVN